MKLFINNHAMTPVLKRQGISVPAVRAAFTLIELLVVIGIIGLLVGITLPSLRNMTKSNSLIAANRQMLDDVTYARQRAIAEHTTVYMIFVPPQLVNYAPPGFDATASRLYTNLYGGQFTTYALLSLRSTGDQPGRANPRYLTGWRTLPQGVFVATNKFDLNDASAFPVANTFPFPYISSNALPAVTLPYVAFDFLGRLITGRDELIPLAHGSIFYSRDAAGNFNQQPADVQELPPGNSVNNPNIIHIDWLTGRPRLERLQIQ